jgi:hypothetical protein
MIAAKFKSRLIPSGNLSNFGWGKNQGKMRIGTHSPQDTATNF